MGFLCAQVVCDWSIKEVNGGIFEGLLPAGGGSCQLTAVRIV